MKKDIHPDLVKEAEYKCACGASYKIPGIKKNVHVEVCSNCHPFYTGKDRILDTEGRVEKFKKKFNL